MLEVIEFLHHVSFQPVCSHAVIAAGEAFSLGEKTSSSTTAQNKPSPIFPGHILYTRTEIPAQRSPAPAQRGPAPLLQQEGATDDRRAGDKQQTDKHTNYFLIHILIAC